MKKIFNSILLCCALALAAAPLTGCSDSDDPVNQGNPGITNINNPKDGRTVSRTGEDVNITFTAASAWAASLQFVSGGDDWATISRTTGETGGDGSVRVRVEKNTTSEERTVKVVLTVNGVAFELCTLTQALGTADDTQLSKDLNAKMHNQLCSDYLWNKEYAALGDKIDMNVSWSEFLETNLVKLGNVNIEDGGYYRQFSSLRGQRFIYSYIQEINSITRAAQNNNLGIGPTNSANYDTNGTIALIVGYVYMGSPADKAGLLRGDMITSINGTRLTSANYRQFQMDLFYNQQGTYTLGFSRYEVLEGESQATLVPKTLTISSEAYAYTPVLTAGVLPYTGDDGREHKIGILATEAFDLSNQDHVARTLQSLKDQNITDLILDLRHNIGGAVAQARYIASAIAGPAHKDDIFLKMEKNDGSIESWTFGYGDINNQDGLGEGPDLGLSRLFVICSEDTASASELVINGLKGIDFPVTLYGSQSAGKNVGMAVRTITSTGRQFEFAPITFRCFNAKGWGDYKDGFPVDHMTNNQDSSLENDMSPLFPYSVRDWANPDEATYWAILNIAGDDDSALKNWTPSTRNVDEHPLTPVEGIVYKFPLGRGGNLVY